MNRSHFILLTGWGMESPVWYPLCEKFREKADFSFIEWRGIDSIAEIKERVVKKIVSKREQSFILLGWSMGALAAIDVAAEYPSSIKRLILFGGTSRFTESDGYAAGWNPRVVQMLKRRLQRDKQGTLIDFYRMMFSPDEQKAGIQDQFLQHIIQKHFQGDETSSLLHGLDYLIENDFRNNLHHINAPLLLIHGANDIVCPSTASEYIAQYAGGPTILKIMSGVGHVPFFTKLDECYLLIKKFIEEGD